MISKTSSRTGIATLPLHGGKAASWRDPARFSFAHGGKDGTPYPVDRPANDRTISAMESAIERAKTGNRDRLDAIRRLARFYEV